MNKGRTQKSRFCPCLLFYRGVGGWLVFYFLFFYIFFLINFLLDGDVPMENREIRIKKDTEN